jgi:large subunit ribosomal protein L18
MRPRLAVYRSSKHIYAQIIGEGGKIKASAGEKEIKKSIKGKKDGVTKTERASLVGEALAKKSLAKKIKQVTFDRRRYRYHGRVKALAEAARKGGLDF